MSKDSPRPPGTPQSIGQPPASTHGNHAGMTVPQAMQHASAAFAGGDWAKAERLCRAILSAHADYFDALSLLGIIAAETQHLPDAAALFERAVASNPLDAAVNYNYGSVLKRLKRFDEALDRYQCALHIKPDIAQAYYDRGDIQIELGRPGEALDSYEIALRIKPDYAQAHNNRGVALQALGRHEDALESYERALKISPDHADANYNHGLALRELGRIEEALGSYDRALEITPDHAEAHNNRGVALQALTRFEESRESFERALQFKPSLAEAWYGLGNALSELGRFEQALDSYERGLELDPEQRWLAGARLLTQMQLCDWRDLDKKIAELDAAIRQDKQYTVPFPVLALRDSLSLQRRAAEIWSDEARRAIPVPSWIETRSRRGKIRLGYYSADFHDHASAYLMAELFESHDRARFDLVAFSFGPDKRDAMRQRLSAAFDRFLDVRTSSDREVAQVSREMDIDIAVDLKGFTQHARHGIFANRAAPVQVNYLGYPGTMGASYMDYIIADRTLIPQQSLPHYTEKVVYLPNSYQVNDRRRQIADRQFSRAELGLPAAGFVFCCFNNSYKITPQTFDSWMRILERVERSVLWLLEDNRTAANNLRREAQARGVSAARLIFAPRMPLPEHLARHRAADLFIDTLPCNAHTTASDALWAGLPVLTRQGESFAARVAASLLNAIGLPELITTTQEQYEARAIELGASPGRSAHLRRTLSENRLTAPLFDTELFTRHIEDAYTQMYERLRAGLNPDHIKVAR